MSGRRARSKSSLAIVENAYRGSLEEQYGHIVWLSRVMRGMGAEHALLLKRDTVLFARRGQPRVALPIGDLVVHDVSHHGSGVADLLAQQGPVFAWLPDLRRVGLAVDELVPGVVPVGEGDLPALIRRYDCVWYW